MQQLTAEPTNPLAGKRVVVIDDEAITHLQLRKVLKTVGAVIAGEARDGEEGVACVLAERPDLVIMDMNMPGLNGLQAAERILDSYRVCIVILSAFAAEEYQEQAKRIGACGYFVKPITGSTLLPALKAAYTKFHHP
jgi:YesN/AraC family two-component response regulator